MAPHLWEMAKLGPADVDVVQSYENFTGGVLMSLVEHGFFKPEEANDFLTLENLLAPTGKLPLNTSGGNLAECYMHGLELQIEAVRQLRGQSTAQVPDAHVGCVIAGPMVTPVSSMILGSEATLVMTYLPPGLPAPVTESDGLDLPYWEGTRQRRAEGPALRRAAAPGSGGRSGSATNAGRSTCAGSRWRARAASTAGRAAGIRCIRR